MYAVVMLAFGDPKYLTGALLCGVMHRELLASSGRAADIELVCLVDTAMWAYRATLRRVFHRVVRIPLEPLRLAPEYAARILPPYTPRLSALYHNKWHALRLTRYAKVLFTDVDIAPVDPRIYDVFELAAPAFQVNNYPARSGAPTDGVVRPQDWFRPGQGDATAFPSACDIRHSINGGFVLLAPNAALHRAYFAWLRRQEPYVSLTRSFPDETSLILFFASRGTPVTVIPPHFSQPTWAFHRGVYSANFLHAVKPWTTAPRYRIDRVWTAAAAAAREKYGLADA